MKISLNSISKRYNNNWIFKNVTYAFESGKIYAILGDNGSGKSTLLRIIAGMQNFNTGTLLYSKDSTKIPEEKIFKNVSYCAPGMDLIEEMTLKEFLKFHFSFKKINDKFNINDIIKSIQLEHSKEKYIQTFSSGMKQRVKLAIAFYSDTPVLLLDEPCSNLDTKGIDWYQANLSQAANSRIVIIASNDIKEYEQAQHSFSIHDYKS